MKIILFFVRRILSLRYKVKITWADILKHDWPVLILPNHVALVDPRIIVSFLWRYLSVSPVASEKYYNMPVLKQIMDAIWTVPIWEMSMWASSEDVKEAFNNIVEALKNWKNILIYPSWEIYRQWFESIKGKQSVFHIVNNMPDNTKIIWVKNKWLWWSIWSKAWDGWESWFGSIYLKCIWYVFANLFFFAPKREVNLDISDLTEELKEYSKKDLNSFNKYLEDFYNEAVEEKALFIKHFFYYNDVKNKVEPEMIKGSIKEMNLTNDYDLSDIDSEVKDSIKKKVSEIKEIDTNLIKDDSKLVLELFFDSLDLAEVKSYVQANFCLASNPPINDLKTMWDLYVMAVWKSQNVEELKGCVWIEKDDSISLSDKLKVS